jgi:hypothetical protein
MFHAMDWFVPGVGAVAVTTGGGLAPVVGEDEDGEEEDDEELGGVVGRVASLGVPTRLRVLAAESSRIICWRSCSSRAAERLPGISARAAAVGSAPSPALVFSTQTPAALASSAVIVVTRRKLVSRRPRRLA